MSATDERILQLLDRWTASVELHARYLELDDAAYARVQQWPQHPRPTRWLVDLARKRLAELGRELAERRSRGDTGFAEALELMGFLTTLLGAEHVERFIPLARPAPGTAVDPAAARAAPIPLVEPGIGRPASAHGGHATPSVRRRKPATPTQVPAPRPAADPILARTEATVIADAARLLSWGREWPQLAGLIARLADRPPEPVVWEILRRHRAEIRARAARPPA